MKHGNLEREWALSQLEAMADGSLGAAESARMRAAARNDPKLALALVRAEETRSVLGRIRLRRPPRGLLGRLLSVPGAANRRWSWITVPAGTLAAALVATLLVVRFQPGGAEERAEAVREFTVAMSYLRRSAAVTRNEVGDRVGAGLADALNASREALAELNMTRSDDGGSDE